MKNTKIYEALHGVRGQKAVQMDKLEQILVNFSYLISENPWIKECDINPLLASHERLIALDARVVLHDLHLKEEELPKVAIRPYPNQYTYTIHLKDHTHVNLRPICPEDEPHMVEFHRALCKESVRQRYLEFISLDARIAHERLIRMCCVDYDRCIALIAQTGKEIIGVIRIQKRLGSKEGDFKMVIADSYHQKGLGTELLEKGIAIARKEKISLLTAEILKDNAPMLHLCEKKGFTLHPMKDNLIKAEKKL